MRVLPLLILTALALSPQALAQNAPAPQNTPPPGPSQDVAREAAAAAVVHCRRLGFRTMATVVDPAGRPVAAMAAGPDLPPALAPDSVRSAQVAAFFQDPSSDVADRIKGEAGVFYAIHDHPQLGPPLPGGVPLTGPDNPKGAIGVAGAPDGAVDEECARAGVAQVAPKLK